MGASSGILELHRLNVDGVPAWWVPAPGPTTAAVTFGVGMGDEAMHQLGIDHLIEHLTLHGLDHRRADFNGMTDDSTTTFIATGSIEAINDVFAHAGRQLAQLPFDRLDLERDVLRTEAQSRSAGTLGAHLSLRFGNEGPGLLSAPELGLWGLDPDAIHAWRSRWFVAANAAIAIAGPSPEGIRIELPDGSPPMSSPVPDDQVTRPSWASDPGNLVSISLVAPRGPAWATAAETLGVAMEDRLRERDGRTYSVTSSRHSIGTDRSLVLLTADCLDGRSLDVQEAMAVEMLRLRSDGPSEATLDLVRSIARRRLSDPRAAMPVALHAAASQVRGRPVIPPREFLAASDRVGPRDVANLLGSVRPTTLWTVPAGTGFKDQRVASVPGWSASAIEGTTYLLGVSTDPHTGQPRPIAGGATERLVVGPDGVSRYFADHPVTVRWDALAAAVHHSDRTWVLHGTDGFTVTVSARSWFRGAAAVDEIARSVPPACTVEIDEAFASHVPDDDPAGPAEPDTEADPHLIDEQAGSSTHATGNWKPSKTLLLLSAMALAVIAAIRVFTLDSGADQSATVLLIPIVVVGVAAARQLFLASTGDDRRSGSRGPRR